MEVFVKQSLYEDCWVDIYKSLKKKLAVLLRVFFTVFIKHLIW